MPGRVSVIVRDGRGDRDGCDTAGPGDILMVLDRERPVQDGELLQLPDGSFGRVVGSTERPDGRGLSQSVTVADPTTA
jgi:hypothetical protein